MSIEKYEKRKILLKYVLTMLELRYIISVQLDIRNKWGDKNMKEKEEVKELYNKLTDENKQVVNLIAKGMIVAQENVKKEVKQALS